MNLYTRTGDDGSTGLFGGDRVRKNDPRIDAYGTVDELNAAIGLVLSACMQESSDARERLHAWLAPLQSRLFDLGADLATPFGTKHEDKIQRLPESVVDWMESTIDEVEQGNDPIDFFVLPGGTEVAARLHLARGICRRAERAIVALGDQVQLNPVTILFVNRLGDLLFACARYDNKASGHGDVPWKPGSSPD